jgi:hypothetical protein
MIDPYPYVLAIVAAATCFLVIQLRTISPFRSSETSDVASWEKTIREGGHADMDRDMKTVREMASHEVTDKGLRELNTLMAANSIWCLRLTWLSGAKMTIRAGMNLAIGEIINRASRSGQLMRRYSNAKSYKLVEGDTVVPSSSSLMSYLGSSSLKFIHQNEWQTTVVDLTIIPQVIATLSFIPSGLRIIKRTHMPSLVSGALLGHVRAHSGEIVAAARDRFLFILSRSSPAASIVKALDGGDSLASVLSQIKKSSLTLQQFATVETYPILISDDLLPAFRDALLMYAEAAEGTLDRHPKWPIITDAFAEGWMWMGPTEVL